MQKAAHELTAEEDSLAGDVGGRGKGARLFGAWTCWVWLKH